MKAWWSRTAGGIGWDHPSDVDLLAELLARGEAEPALPEHVAACAACAARWQALASTLEADRAALRAAADAHFPPDRLERQLRHVARRIEHRPQAARVLPFPAMGMRETPRRQVARRSIAAAALLGLTVGGVAGRLLDRHADAPGGPPPAAAASAQPGGETMAHAAVTADEVFLSELEQALDSPRPAPLSALDALTPQVATGR
jgi:hypothetical protein